ncbi:MAG: pancreas/duodenum homeobox protein 1 [Deltaproteobacteria bacterium]|nr:MAG: pancreas/duodenum homeobox protein 1 [Deltaproteobacteria bacterium]
MTDYDRIFSSKALEEIFPHEKSDEFFEALFGDSEEGAYDISLHFKGMKDDELNFEFSLDQRPGKCLVCSLTYGLPKVFDKHPVINIKAVAEKLSALIEPSQKLGEWRLGNTISVNSEKHLIPFFIKLVSP